MIDLQKYHKEKRLRDGTKVLFRPMTPNDMNALFDFFNSVPDEEIRYLRDNVHDRSVVEKWSRKLDYSRKLPVLAVADDIIVGDITLYRRPFGWKHHLGDVRLFVHKSFRKVGLGSLMVEEMVSLAFQLDLKILLAEIPAYNRAAMNAFGRVGFQRVAIIPGLVRDIHDQPVDLIIMTRDLEIRTEDEFYHF